MIQSNIEASSSHPFYKKGGFVLKLFLVILSIFLVFIFAIPLLAVTVYVPPLGIAILVHFIFSFIFLWRLPITNIAWSTINKFKFFLYLFLLVISGIVLWKLMFIVAHGID